jgi:Tfp pilus assembly protein PilN
VRPVNLLPARFRPARATGERAGIGYVAIGILAALFVMVLLYVVTNNGIDDAKQKTAKATAEQQVAQARIGQLQAYGDFASMKAARESAVKQVAEARFDYERVMREVALVLPHDSYLTSFSSAPAGTGTDTTSTAAPASTGPTVTMAGCAPSHKGVAKVIVRLRQIHNVTDVNLASSTKGTATSPASGTTTGNVCKVAWTGSVSFNAETAPTTPTPVPARLGGGQ